MPRSCQPSDRTLLLGHLWLEVPGRSPALSLTLRDGVGAMGRRAGLAHSPACFTGNGMGVTNVNAVEYPVPQPVVGRGALFVEHRLKIPQVSESAYIAPTAVLAD